MCRTWIYIIVFGIALIYSCNNSNGFTNTLVNEVPNKNGIKAIVFYKTGDATTPDSYQVSLMSENEKLSQSDVGNTFTCKDNSQATVSAKWISKDSLLIEYIKSTTTYIKEAKVKGISIVYREK